MQDGQVYRHNCKHLRRSCEPHPLITSLLEEDQLADHSTTIAQSQEQAEQPFLALQPEAVSTQLVKTPIHRSYCTKRLTTHQ